MSDELTVRLRELAGTAEAPPPGSGAEVRATAGRRRRRRRRRSAAVVGGCAAAGLAAVLTLNVASHGTEGHPSTAASPVPSATAGPDATVDLSRHVLTFAGRELPISAGTARNPTPTGLMTVTGKDSTVVFTGDTVGFDSGYDLKMAWVVTLSPVEASAPGEDGASRTGEATALSPAAGGPIRIAAIAHNEKAPGNQDTTTGWIGLRTTDARWLYERLPEGAVVDIRDAGAAPSRAATPSTAGDQVPTGQPPNPTSG